MSHSCLFDSFARSCALLRHPSLGEENHIDRFLVCLHSAGTQPPIAQALTCALVPSQQTVALSGYFTYGSNVEANVLDSFPVETFATVARLGTAFAVTFSYPLLMHPARYGT